MEDMENKEVLEATVPAEETFVSDNDEGSAAGELLATGLVMTAGAVLWELAIKPAGKWIGDKSVKVIEKLKAKRQEKAAMEPASEDSTVDTDEKAG